MVSIFINIIVIFNILFWLVVEPNPSEKYDFVSWDDYSQLNGQIKHVPNHQPVLFDIPICCHFFFLEIFSKYRLMGDIQCKSQFWYSHQFSRYLTSANRSSSFFPDTVLVGLVFREHFQDTIPRNIGFSMDFQNSLSIYSADLSTSGRIQGWS